MKNHLATIKFNSHCNKEELEFAIKKIKVYSKSCLFNLTNFEFIIMETKKENNEKKK